MRLLFTAAIILALLAGSARAAGPPVLGFSVSSGAQTGLLHVSLPSASTPNAPGSISVPVSFTSPPATVQQLPLSNLQVLWQQAGAAYGIPWPVLASINKIESNFGQNMGPSSAGAVGWMQFMPSTWLRWGLDADGDGIADPWNARDAIYAAARYLAAAGGQTDISRGVFAYNHADWYVRQVLDLARVYGQAGITQTVDLQQVQAKLDGARQEVVRANERLQVAHDQEQQFRNVAQALHARVDAASLLTDRLAAERRAVLYDVRVDAARTESDAARASSLPS
jgi:transglycosylase-like protein with SLT domain